MDIETKDPNLLDYGPGTHRGDGHICGISFAVQVKNKIHKDYLSFAHPDTPTREREDNRKLAAEILDTQSPKIGANLSYDLEWLEHDGFKIPGKKHDVQFAGALLDEYRRSYSLNSLAKHHGLQEKKSNVLQDYCDIMNWKGKPISHIWRMPSNVAAEYAIVDAELPLQLFELQKLELEQQQMYDLYELETDLIPLLVKMRQIGVRIDEKAFKKTVRTVNKTIYQLEQELIDWAGGDYNFGSTTQLAKIFDRKGISYPRKPPTKKMREAGKTLGNPSLAKSVLADMSKRYPICKTILDFRHFNTINNLFLHNWANMLCNGRLYGQFHPLRSDKYGAVSGRFSASKPNLQQVSSKKEKGDFSIEDSEIELQGKILRKLFLPEEGKKWAKLDYSQVEYRIMAHFASGKGSDELRQTYNDNPLTDYHKRVMDLTGFDRKTAKNVNFGGAYGIGAKTASSLFGWTMEESEMFLAGYHKAAPYIRSTRRDVTDTLSRRGYLFTVLRRRARAHPSRKLHSFFNRLIQGSAADVMKKSMVDAHKKGLFDVLDLHMTVHDEVDVSFEDNKAGREALRELKETMENTVKLRVPLIVDCEVGDNWGELEEIKL